MAAATEGVVTTMPTREDPHYFPTPSYEGTELRGVLVDAEADKSLCLEKVVVPLSKLFVPLKSEMATLGSFLRRVHQTQGRMATARKVREFWDGLHLAHRVVTMLATHELTTPVPEADLLDVFLSGLSAEDLDGVQIMVKWVGMPRSENECKTREDLELDGVSRMGIPNRALQEFEKVEAKKPEREKGRVTRKREETARARWLTNSEEFQTDGMAWILEERTDDEVGTFAMVSPPHFMT
eukprot:gene20130-24097_t